MNAEELKAQKEILLIEKANFIFTQDVIAEMKTDKKIAEVTIKICDLLLPKNSSTKLFQPKKSNKIQAVSMEVIGQDYIPWIKGAYNVLAGRGGSGKSGIALKSMIKWLNLNPAKQSLSFFTEDGITEINKRCRNICDTLGLNFNEINERINYISLDNDDRIKWVTENRDGYNINTDYIEEVKSFCLDNSIEFIILDPLKRFHSLSENSNDDMDILVRDIFTDLAVKTKAVLIALHHSSKAQNGARGASTITDSARMAWQIEKYFVQDENNKVMVDPEKKDRIKLEIIKDNMGIEKLCTIREDDNSIDNPLSGIFTINPRRNSEPLEVTEYQSEPTNNDDIEGFNLDMSIL